MSRRWPWRRRATDTASEEPVSIQGDADHEWWAQRDTLDRPIDRRWRENRPQYPFRRATDRLAAEPPKAPRWQDEPLFTATAEPPPPPTGNEPSPPRSEPGFGATPPAPAYPWSVLGLTSDAPWDLVVARHRELAKKHHPDRHGMDDSVQRRQAEQEMATINAAFQDLGSIYRLTNDR